ncbi:MAG TPA: GxxExxY protein, partial [Fermentimonas sp.]|nr:GxxExxY protein [Fermentimonas sp.]
PFEKERRIEIYYKNKLLNKQYIADFVCYGKIIAAQLLNYLKATRFKAGLLVNFGQPKLEYKRYVL